MLSSSENLRNSVFVAAFWAPKKQRSRALLFGAFYKGCCYYTSQVQLINTFIWFYLYLYCSVFGVLISFACFYYLKRQADCRARQTRKADLLPPVPAKVSSCSWLAAMAFLNSLLQVTSVKLGVLWESLHPGAAAQELHSPRIFFFFFRFPDERSLAARK